MAKNTLQSERNSLKVTVEVALFQEDGIWVAYCPALELSSYGDNKEEAKDAFDEAMRIFLYETERKGSLEKYLLKLGWQLQLRPKPIFNQPQNSIEENRKLLKKNPVIYSERVAIPL